VVGAIVIALAVAWLFSSALFSSKVLGGEANLLFQVGFDRPASLTQPVNPYTFDAFYVFHPDMLEARRQLRSLELPTWTTWLGGGEPLLATQQHASLYPGNWPMLVLPFWQSLEWLAALKLFTAGLGTLLLLSALGLRRASALFGAVSYALGLYMVVWVEHPHINAYSLIPWALLCAYRLARSGTLFDAALLALVFGMSLLGGQPESAFLLALLTVPWFFVCRPHRRAVGWFAGSVAAGLALGAVTLLPFAELVSQATQTGRGGGDGEARNWVLGFFMPELWGRPDKYELAGSGTFPERSAYFGALPLMLGVGGLVAWRPRREQIYFAVAALLALGCVSHVPLYTHFVVNLPGFRAVNMDRALVLVALSGAILGAFGLDALIAADRRARFRLLAGAAAVALIPLLWLAGHRDLPHFLGGAWSQLPVMDTKPSYRGDLQMGVVLRWCLLAGAGLALILAAARGARAASVAAALAVALAVVDLVTLGRGYHPAIPEVWADPPPSQTVRLLQHRLGHARFAGGQFDLGPNVAERSQLRDARRHEQPVIARRYDLWTTLGGEGVLQRNFWTKASDRLADLFAVKYMISVPGLAGGWKPAPAPFMFERLRPAPRAWLAYDWRPAANRPAALAAMTNGPAADDHAKPVIEGVPPSSGSPGTASVSFLEDDETTVRLRAVAKRPAQLILDDTYYPGWQATVDGNPVDIHPANVAFRAVSLSPGMHTIEFDYKPWSVRVGALLSLLAAFGIAAALAVSRSQRGRMPRSSRQP
jgi:hypothetical protein